MYIHITHMYIYIYIYIHMYTPAYYLQPYYIHSSTLCSAPQDLRRSGPKPLEHLSITYQTKGARAAQPLE